MPNKRPKKNPSEMKRVSTSFGKQIKNLSCKINKSTTTITKFLSNNVDWNKLEEAITDSANSFAIYPKNRSRKRK